MPFIIKITNRKQKLSALFIFIFFVFSFSCIEQFTPKLDNYQTNGLIVVEGEITNELGPFRIKLSKTFEIDNMQQYGAPVYGADVQIFDDKGNQFQLYHTIEGWYETEDKKLEGVVGNTYTLSFTLDDGTQYESSSVLMREVPDIEHLYHKEVTKTRFEDGKVINENWLDIMVDSKDPLGQTKYWKWDYEETWEVHMPKDSVHIIINPEDGPNYLIVVNLEFLKGNLKYGWDNKKEKCWVTIPSTSIHVKTTQNKTVDEIISHPITSIPPSGDRLHVKYSILVKQTALDKNIYNFWKRLSEINETSGSIYDKTPSQIFGNIDCCIGNGKALGYFTASTIKTKRIFIDPLDHNIKTQGAYSKCGFDAPPWYSYYATIVASQRNPEFVGRELYTSEWCSDCRFYAKTINGGGSINQKPDFWED